MAGHGHVTPNPDGSKARCGGPAICSVCAREAASKPKPPTGTGLIGQTGNKPGGSYEGMTKPPREGLYDPHKQASDELRRSSGYDVDGGSTNVGVGVLAALTVSLLLSVAALGFYLGRTL